MAERELDVINKMINIANTIYTYLLFFQFLYRAKSFINNERSIVNYIYRCGKRIGLLNNIQNSISKICCNISKSHWNLMSINLKYILQLW